MRRQGGWQSEIPLLGKEGMQAAKSGERGWLSRSRRLDSA